jgi:hypothetical protein
MRAFRTQHQTDLKPKAATFAYCHELSGLKMSPAQASELSVRVGPFSKAVNDDSQLVEKEIQASAQENQVGVAFETNESSRPASKSTHSVT